MPTEQLLVKTKDERVAVCTINYNDAAEKAQIVGQCEQFFATTDIIGFNTANFPVGGAQVDVDNTEFINREISGYRYRKQPNEFNNGLQTNNYPANVCQPDTLHFDNTIADNMFPLVIQNIGYKIEPVDKIYDVVLNPATNEYEVPNKENTCATVYKHNKRMEIVRNHFKFPPAEYVRIRSMITQFEQAKQANPKLDIIEYATNKYPNRKDYSLFNVYMQEYLRLQHIDKTIGHEFDHVIDGIFYDGLELKDDCKRMTVENCYKAAVDLERKAYFGQLIRSLNTYLQKGDLSDYTMFDNESRPFAERLKALPNDAERLSYATNYPLLMQEMFEQFKQEHKPDYDANQFPVYVDEMIKKLPLSVPEENNDEQYLRLRRLYYQFDVYNPTSGRMERMSFADNITPNMEVEITPQIQTAVIDVQKQNLQNYLTDFTAKKNSGRINVGLVGPAKAMLRQNLQSTEYVNEINNLRVADLLEEPQNNPNIPNNNAGWSDNLQQYWSGVNGYQEIAKNNLEYSFKINEASVRYTAENKVEISNNADFALYVKLLHEPSNANKPVEFLDTLTPEQALTLYIACVNYGRQPVGNIPQDLSGIANLQGIPPAELNRFRHRTGGGNNTGNNGNGGNNGGGAPQRTFPLPRGRSGRGGYS